MTKVMGVRFTPDGKTYFFDPGELTAQRGEWVVVETSRGDECGQVSQPVHLESDSRIKKPLRPVKRLADSIDIRRMEQNRKDEERAFAVCEERIPKHGLDMKLVRVEYAFDRSKITFFFTADGRVDFRELVKDLAGVLRTRIELRQIGVRDESKMLGGLGICGQPLCCSRFLTDFQPVSIKMAKEQGLSLNPAKISGTCGRLMCCLGYEQNAYEYLNAITPSQGSVVNTPEGQGVVTETMVAAGKVKVRLEKAPESPPHVFRVPEVEYIRGGKNKRPPIPIEKEPEPEEDILSPEAALPEEEELSMADAAPAGAAPMAPETAGQDGRGQKPAQGNKGGQNRRRRWRPRSGDGKQGGGPRPKG